MFLDSWLIAFVMTIFIEGAVMLVCARLVKKRPLLTDLLVLNLITHPAAFVVSTTDVDFWTVEIVVIAAEAVGYLILSPLKWQQALSLALATNLASLSIAFL